jgi:transcriptional regulator with GAF, ATPase, and Fis domain
VCRDQRWPARILRTLQEGETKRLGGTRTLRVEVRALVAMHRDRRALAAEGRFRGDRFFRPALLSLLVSPLGERGHGVLPLAERFAREFGKPATRLSRAAAQRRPAGFGLEVGAS